MDTARTVKRNSWNPVTEEVPRAYQELKLFGSRNVTILPNTHDPDEMPFLLLRELMPTAKVKWDYSEKAALIEDDSGDIDNIDLLYTHEEETSNRTETTVVSRLWIKPWALFSLDASFQESANKFKEMYPKGACAVICNDNVMEIYEEDFSDVWTFTMSPISKTIHDDPAGQIIIGTQDLINEVYNLTAQTIAQGIPERFVDPSVMDTETYSGQSPNPGANNSSEGK